MQIIWEFLLGFAIVMEIPMIMILLSRMLPNKSNRIFQLIAATFLVFVQARSHFVGEVSLHYCSFSIYEIGLLVAILWQAMGWGIHPVDYEFSNSTKQIPAKPY